MTDSKRYRPNVSRKKNDYPRAMSGTSAQKWTRVPERKVVLKPSRSPKVRAADRKNVKHRLRARRAKYGKE